jgi:hypothetical protein
MKTGDMRLVFNDGSNRLKAFKLHPHGLKTLDGEWEARNDTVRLGFGTWGACPRGEFKLGAPLRVYAKPFGHWFIPVLDMPMNPLMRLFHRKGIGIHGGGSCAGKRWADPIQPWCKTQGCIRVHNQSLGEIAALVRRVQQAGGTVYLTVAGEANE